MIKLVDLLNEINEGVNDNFLYHDTSLENLLGIIKSNFILIPSDKYISFSRYKNMPNQEYDSKLDAKIVIDKDKLKTKYKTTPYVDPLDDEEEEDYSLYSKQSKWFQAEEVVKGPVDIKNAIKIIELPNEQQWFEKTSKYITSFYPPSTYSTRLRRDNEPIPSKIKNMFKNILTGLKKNNIPYKIR